MTDDKELIKEALHFTKVDKSDEEEENEGEESILVAEIELKEGNQESGGNQNSLSRPRARKIS